MGYARSILNEAGLVGDFRQNFWAYAAALVTQQNNILPNNGTTEILVALMLALIGLAAVIMLERLAGEEES